MPGVDLELMASSEDQIAPLSSLDGECAESGLEAVIGDLLGDSLVDDPADTEGRIADEEVGRLELTLQCAVKDVHCDLKAFSEHIDARLEEVAAQVAPAIEAIAVLQEESLQLQLQRETLARQVEALCHALGLTGPQLQQDQDPEPLNKLPSDSSPQPILHPPTFSLQRSSSTSSQTGCLSRSNSMVYFWDCMLFFFFCETVPQLVARLAVTVCLGHIEPHCCSTVRLLTLGIYFYIKYNTD